MKKDKINGVNYIDGTIPFYGPPIPEDLDVETLFPKKYLAEWHKQYQDKLNSQEFKDSIKRFFNENADKINYGTKDKNDLANLEIDRLSYYYKLDSDVNLEDNSK